MEREAEAYLARALRHAEGLKPEERAGLLESCSYECYLTGEIEQAMTHRMAALSLRRELASAYHISENLRWVSSLYWFLGWHPEAMLKAQEAIAALGNTAPSHELGMAMSNLSQL